MNLDESYWLVGASWDDVDQTERFIGNGVWENGYDDKYQETVNSIKPGELIAIKSSYTRKSGVPFNARDHSVSTMAIKAVGRVIKNYQDGKRLDVDWGKQEPTPKEWYFYTNIKTIWRLRPNNWMAENLINFTFKGQEQDINRFRNDPFWSERFGDPADGRNDFKWTRFYEECATKLRAFSNKREKLLTFVIQTAEKHALSYILSHERDDIDPFTVMGMFNRSQTDENRMLIAADLAEFLNVETDIPRTFKAIPLLNNQKSWFFWGTGRGKFDIDNLWKFFNIAIAYADDHVGAEDFIKYYDTVVSQKGVRDNITMGLFWIRPWAYPSYEKKSRLYLKNLPCLAGSVWPKNARTGNEYLKLQDNLISMFHEDHFPVHSFPELSLMAASHVIEESQKSYSIEDAMGNLFMEEVDFLNILETMKLRKNVILQGPPGVGKTYIAKRLAYALMGHKGPEQCKMVQFHQSYAYEDFIRGYRPTKDGFELRDGVFYNFCEEAKKNPEKPFVFIIDEINRGNLSKILGELMMLIERDKRGSEWSMPLTYGNTEEPFYVPENIYILGMMNTADRSLSLVDYALRRRFSFIKLKPEFNSPKFRSFLEENKVGNDIVDKVYNRITALNHAIKEDHINLGEGFEVGHSFFCPDIKSDATYNNSWYQSVIQTEILPLLQEYWFDDLKKLQEWESKLLA